MMCSLIRYTKKHSYCKYSKKSKESSNMKKDTSRPFNDSISKRTLQFYNPAVEDHYILMYFVRNAIQPTRSSIYLLYTPILICSYLTGYVNRFEMIMCAMLLVVYYSATFHRKYRYNAKFFKTMQFAFNGLMVLWIQYMALRVEGRGYNEIVSDSYVIRFF